MTLPPLDHRSLWSQRHGIGSAIIVALALGSACQSDAGRAEDAGDRTTPCEGKCDATDAGIAALPAVVQSISWDAQVVIGLAGEGAECRVMAVRPERIQATEHAVTLPPSVFSPGVACPSALGAHALVADTTTGPNPAVVDGEATYQMLVYGSTDDAIMPTLTVQPAQVVVSQAGTADAEVTAVTWSGAAQALTSAGGQPMHGIAPTLTADGGLLIFQGRPGDATDDQGRLRTDSLVYARRPGSAPLGAEWTTPRSLTELVEERNTLVDGVLLGERYPLAAGRLKVPDGRGYPPGFLLFGEHPWVSRDGTELLYTAAPAGPVDADGEQARTGALSVVGLDTGHGIRPIDGPVNPSREGLDGPATRLGLNVSPGRSPGFWASYADAGVPLAHGPAYPLLGQVGEPGARLGTYNEVDFTAYHDGDYRLYLPMNESLAPARDGSLDYDPTRTPDLSGNFHPALLEDGARFAVEQFGRDAEGRPLRDENTGARGRAVYFPEQGRVRVPRGWDLQSTSPFLTVELFVQRLEPVAETRAVFSWPGAVDVLVHGDGRLEAVVIVGGERRSSGPVGEGLPLDAWTHVAFTYEANSGTLRTFVDGAPVGEVSFDPGLAGPVTGDIIVGPDGRGVGLGLPDEVAIVALDEVAISRVVRTDEELARAAGTFVAEEPTWGGNASLLALIDLPEGLDAEQLRVPADNAVSEGAVELGQMLFFDPRLSANGEISCATCHDPAFGWSDGLATGFGIDDQALGRNSPTILNIAMSTEQFWDGRAETAEMQALGPIVSPVEMGSNLGDVLQFLSNTPGYADRFQAVYGEGPTQDNLARAIASFERTVLSGGTAVDRFEAGELDALTDAERRGRALFHGKGRCGACHGGSNYTDEDYHFTGLRPASDDLGRFGATGRTRDLHAFKTPTLRNIADTGPYFHDGGVETLADVVELYNGGGTVPGHDREVRPLDLSAAEQADLVAFLEALSDPDALVMEAPALPGLE